MHFRAEHYHEAALEKLRDALALYGKQRYVGCIYFSGVAVECLLRAYRVREDPEFDSRHDLLDLARESCIAEFILPEQHREFGAKLGDVWSRWKNDYRFASEQRLHAEFRALKLYVTKQGGFVKGDLVKYNAWVAYESAGAIITLGDQRWHSKRK